MRSRFAVASQRCGAQRLGVGVSIIACPNCGASVNADAAGCQKCGANLQTGELPAWAAATPPIPGSPEPSGTRAGEPILVATLDGGGGKAGRDSVDTPREITFADGALTLERNGPIGSQDILKYEKKGRITWATEDSRSWVIANTPASSAVNTGSQLSCLGCLGFGLLSLLVTIIVDFALTPPRQALWLLFGLPWSSAVTAIQLLVSFILAILIVNFAVIEPRRRKAAAKAQRRERRYRSAWSRSFGDCIPLWSDAGTTKGMMCRQ